MLALDIGHEGVAPNPARDELDERDGIALERGAGDATLRRHRRAREELDAALVDRLAAGYPLTLGAQCRADVQLTHRDRVRLGREAGAQLLGFADLPCVGRQDDVHARGVVELPQQ